jgi:hypothetical protein
MAVASFMLALGTTMPAFTLPDTGCPVGPLSSKRARRGQPRVVYLRSATTAPMLRNIQAGRLDFGRWCREQAGLWWPSARTMVDTYPADAPALMTAEAKRAGYVWQGAL